MLLLFCSVLPLLSLDCVLLCWFLLSFFLCCRLLFFLLTRSFDLDSSVPELDSVDWVSTQVHYCYGFMFFLKNIG